MTRFFLFQVETNLFTGLSSVNLFIQSEGYPSSALISEAAGKAFKLLHARPEMFLIKAQQELSKEDFEILTGAANKATKEGEEDGNS